MSWSHEKRAGGRVARRKSLLEGRSRGEGSRQPVFPAKGEARAWAWRQHSLVPHQPGAEAHPSKDQGPFATWGLRGAPAGSQSLGGGVHGGGNLVEAEPRQLAREGGAETLRPLSHAGKPRAPGSGGQEQTSRRAQGRAGGCAVDMGSRPVGGAGRCLQGSLRALRRLLHHLHKEVPAWGCPGADRPL